MEALHIETVEPDAQRAKLVQITVVKLQRPQTDVKLANMQENQWGVI